jgi:bifunctional DNA-binding transcriptional regulator/antitoxin component of YhaV-PrlF toxin-antitoxin module
MKAKYIIIEESDLNKSTEKYSIKLPQAILKAMGWGEQDSVIVSTITGKNVQNYVIIEKEK